MTRRMLTLVMVGLLLAGAGAYGADTAFKLGAVGGVTVGGDVENASFIYGLQGVAPLHPNFSLEGAVTMMRDSDAAGDLDLEFWNLALSARAGANGMDLLGKDARSILPAAEALYFYLGGGPAFNIYINDAKELDDNIGFQVFGGFEIATGERGEIFLEYRYNFVKLEAHGEDEDHNMGAIRFGASLLF